MLTPETIEALNKKYSLQVALVLRLTSGNYALFDRRYRLEKVVDNPDEVLDFINRMSHNDPGLVSGNPNEPPATPAKRAKLNKSIAAEQLLRELGL